MPQQHNYFFRSLLAWDQSLCFLLIISLVIIFIGKKDRLKIMVKANLQSKNRESPISQSMFFGSIIFFSKRMFVQKVIAERSLL